MHRVRNPFGVLWHEVNVVQDEFSRMFNRSGHPVPTNVPLLLNVWEDEQALFVEADLPGVDAAKLEITVTEGNQLSIQGERAAPEITGASWVRQERPVGKFARVVELPTLVDADKVVARYDSGVLRLTLPKVEAVKPKRITVSV